MANIVCVSVTTEKMFSFMKSAWLVGGMYLYYVTFIFVY